MAKSRLTAARVKNRNTVRRPGGHRTAKSLPASLGPLLIAILILTLTFWWFNSYYTLTFQLPIRLNFEWPVVIAERVISADATAAAGDQPGRRLSAWQQYTCRKFGSDCRLALAIQRAENPQGKCEIYHYNADGTLDWGYFQINTVHLKRPGLNLRDLLDCKANIDFAYQLYREKGDFTAWSSYNNGTYKRFMRR